MRKALPKVGFAIEKTEWNEQHNAIRFVGKYQDDYFMVDAFRNNMFINIYDCPWNGVQTSDPVMPRLMEAVNEVNAGMPNMSVIVDNPDKEGYRQIYTMTTTILPTFLPERYLESLMCEMLNRKPALMEALKKERPYMESRRSTVGFNVNDSSQDTPASPSTQDELSAPAAENDSIIES